VDDNGDVRAVFQEGMQAHGFEVVAAATVSEALRLISTEKFDVLLSDLHIPDAGDGFTVVSAMRHAHPNAVTVTLVFSGYPALQEAMAAILLEADEILVKPVGLAAIAEIIQKKLANPSVRMSMKKERVAEILERDAEPTIRDWMSKVEQNEELCRVSLSYKERTGHLPLLLGDLVRRLAPNAHLPNSTAAREHGIARRKQGYTVAMAVEESRILQVSIFGTLQNNLRSVDFSSVLLDVMTIADEVDSQLKQAMLGFMESPAPRSASWPA